MQIKDYVWRDSPAWGKQTSAPRFTSQKYTLLILFSNMNYNKVSLNSSVGIFKEKPWDFEGNFCDHQVKETVNKLLLTIQRQKFAVNSQFCKQDAFISVSDNHFVRISARSRPTVYEKKLFFINRIHVLSEVFDEGTGNCICLLQNTHFKKFFQVKTIPRMSHSENRYSQADKKYA